MRIITGTLGGRVFSPRIPEGVTRPTTDLAKESLFNILEQQLEWDEITALDLFAGTGSITYELFSRGAARVVCVEQHRTCAAFIRSSLTTYQIPPAAVTLIERDVFRFLNEPPPALFGFIFADPPYRLARLPDLPNLLLERGTLPPLLAPDGLLVLEHDAHNSFKEHPRFERERAYGATRFSFFR